MDSSYASESDEEMSVDNEDDTSIKSRPERVKNDQKSVESPNSKRNVILGDLEEELEKQLEEKAIRNELSEANVKSLLKAVLTHEDVRKYVEFATNRSDEQPEYHMKLTRAKAKQLIDRLPEIAPLLCVPCTPKKSDINLLLEEELLNDTDDDDEFIPTHETVEEDDESIFTQGDDSSVASLMSPPPPFSDRSVASSPALFDNISLRTRSKFSLSDTPLETLERAFVPPDVPKDLYDPVKGNPEWLNFLQGLVQPIDSRADSPEEVFHESDADENDDETDPEYNVMSDEELEAPDVDELRNDRTVQVSKKEVSELMAELAEFTQMLEEGYHSEEENGEADEAIEDLINAQPLHAFPEVQIPPNDPEDFLVEMENFPPVLSSQQILLIQQQLLQHIQLLLQSYLLSLGNPFVDAGCRKASKDRLVEIRDLGAASCGSVLSSPIMKDTFYVIESYERHVSAHEKYLWEWHRVALSSGKKAPHVPLHPYLMEICLKSCAFPYPLLLPKASFKPSTYARALSFSDAAHWLIASGLDDCVTNLKLNINITATLRVACDVIRSALLPDKTTDSILRHVLNRKKAASSNPIKNYFLGKGHPIVEHFVTGVNPELLYKKDALLFDNSWHFSLYSVRDQIKRHKSKEIESIVPPQ